MMYLDVVVEVKRTKILGYGILAVEAMLVGNQLYLIIERVFLELL